MNFTNLESKVVSLELAKRMKELGWKKRTIFCWCIKDLFEDDDIQIIVKPTEIAKESGCTRIIMSPLFCEVWDELPERIKVNGLGCYLHACKNGYSKNFVGYIEIHTNNFNMRATKSNNNIVEAISELWCWLKENGYIK